MESDLDYADLFESPADDYGLVYDYYDDELEESPDYAPGGSLSFYTLKELWDNCLILTLTDGTKDVLRVMAYCIGFKLISSLRFLPPFVLHCISAVTGLLCLHSFFGSDVGYVVALAVIGISILLFIPSNLDRWRGLLCTIVCVTYLVCCELWVVESVQWHKIRGTQMVLTMKIISLAFDMDGMKASTHRPSIVECLGYFFCVGTVLFGPWVPFANYIDVIHKPMNISWLFKVAQSFSLSLIFLSISTCWSMWIFPYNSWLWIEAYRDALSFRCSHYFISFLSEATAIASGLSMAPRTWSMKVASPLHIELPRSLVEVVIYWNMPMHSWLKTYVYKTARHFGKFVAILSTFAASSLLHGLNFQLAAVLLSLGFYTYVENAFRAFLADTYNACILARKCKADCSHQNKSNNIYVRMTNIGFGLLAMFHLAYLGVMFNTSQLEEVGYSMEHTLHIWKKLNFASHWTALATYLMFRLIS